MSNQYEGLGDKWVSLLADPENDALNMVPVVLEKGVTREAWRVQSPKTATMLMVYPQDTPLRAGLLLHGKPGALKPVSFLPFMEGIPNDLTVENVKSWKNGVEAYVAATRNPDGEPIFFHTALYARDKDMLTPGVRHTFVLAGLAYGVRRALLDEMTITEGPQYEAYAEQWLEANPDKSRMDVPQLSISLEGARILKASAETFGDYQLRAPISTVEETVFGDEKVYIFGIELGINTDNPLVFVLYVPQRACKLENPKPGDEIDALLWLQGRIIDMPSNPVEQ